VRQRQLELQEELHTANASITVETRGLPGSGGTTRADEGSA